MLLGQLWHSIKEPNNLIGRSIEMSQVASFPPGCLPKTHAVISLPSLTTNARMTDS
ncbi:hypothetical protein SAMN04488032_11717 [Pacificibacter marinus]|uniref:Uncharacterized protein n=1 Tax=Pacificibacter marinus TaxID=658057 RepID=A0A1Y5RTC4_9RHOB|nr:hypothetical protein SAMN04488032_11717 [Pacificibacter marinus]SLN22260.1 hypothetical protein PAM7971_00666 [Pacificibacter marinus]